MTLMILPILLPLAGAALSTLFRRSLAMQKIIAVLVSAAILLSSALLLRLVLAEGMQVMYIGAWEAPFGISFIADTFSALMLLLTGVLGFTVTIYSLSGIDKMRQCYGYFRLLHILLMGVSGAFLTGDLFNLYVWFEVMLIASFVLMVLGNERAQLEGAVKYVVMNLLASVFFLIGIGVLYGKTGTLNFADLAFKLSTVTDHSLVNVSAVLFLLAFGIKSALFPFFFWLPDSYHVPPPAITAIFSGLLTKVGVYALLRTFSLIFVHDQEFTQPVFLALAGLTMLTGVLGAVAQNEMRRLLSFHIVSQIGYAIMGLAIFNAAAFSGAIYFIVHVAIAKAALFLITGYILATRGSTKLKELGGLLRYSPFLSILFFLSAMSLAGMPPLSGFFAKFALVKAGFEAGQHLISAVALAVGMLTLFSMTKIWGEAFWNERSVVGDAPRPAITPLTRFEHSMYLFPTLVLVALTVLMGIGAEAVFEITDRAAAELFNPTTYISTVLGIE